jgi:hypothetical protein
MLQLSTEPSFLLHMVTHLQLKFLALCFMAMLLHTFSFFPHSVLFGMERSSGIAYSCYEIFTPRILCKKKNIFA